VISLIDRRGLIVTEDTEHVRVTAPLPLSTAAVAPAEAATNKAFTNTTVADVNPSIENQLGSSDQVYDVLSSLVFSLASLLDQNTGLQDQCYDVLFVSVLLSTSVWV